MFKPLPTIFQLYYGMSVIVWKYDLYLLMI